MRTPRIRIFIRIIIILALLGFIIVSISGCAGAGKRFDLLEEKNDQLSARVDTLETCAQDFADHVLAMQDSLRQIGDRLQYFQRGIASYVVPKSLYFAGVGFDFDTPDKRDRLDQAILFWVNNHALLQRIHQRAWLYFGDIEQILVEENLGKDFKYVPVVESTLNPNAKSVANAVGPWQFVPATGAQYGLVQSETVDLRKDLRKSTRAAAKHLNYLLGEFNHDIPLALASYNYGEGNVTKAMEKQGIEDFFRLALPRETEEYVFRIFAAKIIFENPGKYGVVLETRDYWERVQKDTVTVKVANRLSLRMVADWTGSYYRAIKQLNPELVGDGWGPGTWTINLPRDTRKRFLDGLTSLRKKK